MQSLTRQPKLYNHSVNGAADLAFKCNGAAAAEEEKSVLTDGCVFTGGGFAAPCFSG